MYAEGGDPQALFEAFYTEGCEGLLIPMSLYAVGPEDKATWYPLFRDEAAPAPREEPAWNEAGEPIPALDDKTPREAIKTKAGRKRVELLLRQYTHHEAQKPAWQRFDFDQLRAQLGRRHRDRGYRGSS